MSQYSEIHPAVLAMQDIVCPRVRIAKHLASAITLFAASMQCYQSCACSCPFARLPFKAFQLAATQESVSVILKVILPHVSIKSCSTLW